MNDLRTSQPPPTLLSLSEVAEALGHAVSTTTLWRAYRRGDLPGVRIGRKIFVSSEWPAQMTRLPVTPEPD